MDEGRARARARRQETRDRGKVRSRIGEKGNRRSGERELKKREGQKSSPRAPKGSQVSQAEWEETCKNMQVLRD